MIIHYFTLQALAARFSSSLHHARIEAVFSQNKNELALELTDIKDEQYDTGGGTMIISIDPAMNYTMLRDHMPRARKNSVDLFPHATGRRIERVGLHPYDRIIHLDLGDGYTFLLLLYGTVAGNILLIDGMNRIVEAFKHNKTLQGTTATASHTNYDPIILDVGEHFRQALIADQEAGTYTALKRAVPFLGSTYSREILHRLGVQEETAAVTLSDSIIEEIRHEVRSIVRRAPDDRIYLYRRSGGGNILSVVPLQHLIGVEAKMFDDVNEAIRFSVRRSFRLLGFDAEKKKLSGTLKSRLDQIRRSLASMDQEIREGDRAEEYDRFGKIIMANLQHLTKGTREVEIPNPFVEGKQVHLTLDPLLTPVQNAERCFTKAKKARSARNELLRRTEELERGRTSLETMILHLDQCQTADELKEFRQTYEKELPSSRGRAGSPQERIPFRTFTVGGYEILVGKDSASNDLLTMTYARPHDLWFHVRGAGGSHVLLRTMPGKPPPGEVLRRAASIAAYYSKMRKAGNVPVAYCERRHLRKPRGAQPGSVVLERETVIFAQPGLP